MFWLTFDDSYITLLGKFCKAYILKTGSNKINLLSKNVLSTERTMFGDYTQLQKRCRHIWKQMKLYRLGFDVINAILLFVDIDRYYAIKI